MPAPPPVAAGRAPPGVGLLGLGADSWTHEVPWPLSIYLFFCYLRIAVKWNRCRISTKNKFMDLSSQQPVVLASSNN